MRRTLISGVLASALAVPAAAVGEEIGLEGRVLSAAGLPVEHARVALAERGEAVSTGPDGRFALPEARPPLELIVTHPRFQQERLRLEVIPAAPLEIVLEPKQAIYEEIAVSANRGEEGYAPLRVAASVLQPADAAAPAANPVELLIEAPGVAENGQGGIFQTYSVRGVSRQRLQTLVSGMRIVAERRAGVSASFVDPLLLGTAEVLRGPASTEYGSGALGGVVQLFARRFTAPAVEVGHSTRGDESYLMMGWGDDRWSAGVARRSAGSAEAPDGELLASGYTRTSLAAFRGWRAGRLRLEVEGLASASRDIDKASTDFPERTTVYPREDHLLLRFGVRSEAGWRLDAWIHPNDLETRVTETGGAVSEVENQAFDLGASWQRRVALGGTARARFGLDYFGRRAVEARETTTVPGGGVSTATTLEAGREDEAGVYAVVEWDHGRTLLFSGGRLAWQRLGQAGAEAASDLAWAGFAGLVTPLGNGLELAGNLSSGLRFPSLGERFFSGTTGRGEIEANPDLEPEDALNLDLGLRWYGERLYLAGFLFRNRIDGYIERLETAPDVLALVNLGAGTIQGAEVEGLWQPDPAWRLVFGGHAVDGRDEARRPLADVPADRLWLGGHLERGRWSARVRWERRLAKNDPGSGEKSVPGADLVSAGVRVGLAGGLALSVSGRNLLDETYFASADRKVPASAGRSVAVGLSWSPPPPASEGPS